ncbi:hypothetical protein L6R29_22210 [Myxococcota bacterium]|nr:hypothetical protein [Myxococcota bacterium]
MRNIFFVLLLCWSFLGISCLDTQIALMSCPELHEAFRKFAENHPNDCEKDDDCELLAVKGEFNRCNEHEFLGYADGFAASKKYNEFRLFHDRYFSKDCDGKRAHAFDRPLTSQAVCYNKRCKVQTNDEFVCPHMP